MAIDDAQLQAAAQDILAAQDKTEIEALLAPGPWQSNPTMEGRAAIHMLWGIIGGVPRILGRDDERWVMELTSDRVHSIKSKSRILNPVIVVDVYLNGFEEDGGRACALVAGPKKEMRDAFALLGFRV